uniref:PABS domain-containing protein n=1 Tax=Scylla olivacea TaxID=85551 RepID=A0A0P4W7I3_SCYOL
MLSGVALAPPTAPVLVVGLGGGALASALHHSFPQVVVAVELDKAMVEVASNWFDFKVDERMKVEVCDGLDYIRRAAEEGSKFGAILFDVDSKDTSVGLSCPPASFLHPSFLQDVSRCLVEEGLLIVNLVCRDPDLRSEVLNDVKSVFPSVLLQDIPQEVNCILQCLQEPLRDTQALKRRFEEKVKGQSGKFCESYGKNVNDLIDMIKNVSVL